MKHTDKICTNCGSTKVIAKWLCHKCYHRNYIATKGRISKPRAKKYNVPEKDYTPTYNKVLEEVKNGLTIQNACILLGIHRETFYRNITPIQKKEINAFKITNCYKHVDPFLNETYKELY